MEAQRYSLRKNLNIYWTVFDDVTGQKAVLDGFVIDMVTAEEGDELVGMLNRKGSEDFFLPKTYLPALTGFAWPKRHRDLMEQTYVLSAPDVARSPATVN
ncbi:hypothetical protein J2W42_000042 [Rhizobium tibeticum]|uniref:hypothetical protein n=1 Tax=Rhizobium tibeticum TaxID=501024 RepID=UPI002784EED1|nr:hypothetical protein [Rhizobium tibeticum]MDP9807211.1 hypothetical protein [Rhizobium tibeticum]